jgi:DNA-binding MarR family transcriptional regulator
VTGTRKSRAREGSATATIVVSRIDMIAPSTTMVEVRLSSGERVNAGVAAFERVRGIGILNITQRYGVVKEFRRCDNRGMGLAEDAFERLRRVAFEGEHVERMAALGTRTKLSPGVIKTLMRLSQSDGVSMGEMARGIGVDPSYITALVDDLDSRGLARREPAPYDRRVKIIVITAAGRKLAAEIDSILSVPPAAFASLTSAELRQLRDLLEKVLAAREAERAAKEQVAAAS